MLVIRPGGLGDAIHLIPFLRACRGYFRDAEIHLLMERRNAGLVPPALAQQVFLYDRNLPRELWAALRGGYDAVVDTEQWYHLSAIVAYLTGAPIRCGFASNRRARLFTHPVPYDETGYEARVFLSLFEALSGQRSAFDDDATYLETTRTDREWAETALAAVTGRPLVVMAPAAPIPERQWHPERYAAVAQRLAARGWATVLVGAPADRPVCATVATALEARSTLDLSGRTTIAESAAVIARATVYVSSDGGLLHVAHALGVATVGLFGAGIASKWAPRGRRARIVRHPLPCSPCTRWGHAPPCPRNVECLERLSVDQVVSAVEDLAAATER